MNIKGLISADWSAPVNVEAVVATKQSDVKHMIRQKKVQLLQQMHGNKVYKLDSMVENLKPKADAIYTQVPNIVCGIYTADCLPVFFSDKNGCEIALAHAGWRGLVAGVLENSLACFKAERDQIIVWFGPAIGSCHFEVGEEVRDLYLQQASSSTKISTASAFIPSVKPNKWMANLYELAKIRLNDSGVSKISGGDLCTFCDIKNFYSYRRDKEAARLFSLIWLN